MSPIGACRRNGGWSAPTPARGSRRGSPPTGRAFDIPGFDVWQVDNEGRAVSVHAYWNVGTLLTQLGLG